ncbi:H(+)/Cl(-) exchange transporter 7 [Parasteatoda tepidariorum]|uniref:H(+)/Cl(-) exchange transporter 7 n=1 Tax=Parasteatoda tepidariorum TaxID=114398 RepID=UPI001C719786|nr:H(+)/Cl(-) exchange transporter 7 [Parasteatoda tepidariorum]
MDQLVKHRTKMNNVNSFRPPSERTPLLHAMGNSPLVLSADHGSFESPMYSESFNSTYENLNTNRKISVGMSNLLSQKYESLDYDICENTLFASEQIEEQTKIIQGTTKGCLPFFRCLDYLTSMSILRWFIICMIGILTACVGVIITISIEELSNLKFKFIRDRVVECTTYSCLITPYSYWLLFSILPVALGASLVVFVAPVAAGSGIPVIKCYLNGVKVPEVVRLKTLIVKALGVTTSVLGGLACGKEGPMIHCGAVIAAGISQGKSQTLRKNCKIFEQFREDHEKRDFVSAGAAAGVAAAFGAPVGGVLFSLEEGASFWNQSLTWRIFFCSMVSYFTLNSVMSEYHGYPGQLSFPGLVNFGRFDNLDYTFKELPLYMVMGVIGGLLGALYNHVNYMLTVFRMRYVKHPVARILEAVLVSAFGVTLAYMTTFIHFCSPYDQSDVKFPIQLDCENGQFNTFWSIWLQTPEACLRSLLHDDENTWHVMTLTIYFFAYLLLGCWTYGLSISSGLFIPTLAVGAAWGRLYGIAVTKLLLYVGFPPEALCYSKFAIVGAAATLGGVIRMTISLTVILMEALGNITFGLPIMLCVMISKWVADIFNEGLYDIHIQLQSVPFLGWEPPPYSYTICASQIMSYPVVCLKVVEKVGFIEHMLKTESHNGFPVVDITESSYDNVHTFGTFRGMILRWQLIVLLQHKVFEETNHIEKLTLKDFRDSYPRHPTIQQIHISPCERNFTIDLSPFMNSSAYTISHKASLPRIFKLFRALGLRHLPVTDEKNSVVGIVTRKDIARYRAKHGKFGVEELQVSYA